MAEPRTTFLEQLIEPTVNHLGYELWGVEQTGSGRYSRVRIYIDAPTGISVSDCESVSHQVEMLLAVEDGRAGSYELEVSSPGIDRVLFKPEHYKRNVGECIDVRLRLPMAGTAHLRGTLQECNDEAISLMVEDELRVIPLTQVRRTRLVPTFE